MLNTMMAQMPAYLLVFARMGGMIFFNPMFSRKNLPTQVRVGLAFFLTLLLVPVVDAAPLAAMTTSFDIVAGLFRELFIGFLCAYVFLVFYYMLFFVGDMMDVQFGLSMAKVFDPGSSIQMSISSNILSLLFMLFILVTDSHLLLIKIFASSYQLVPMGAASMTFEVASFAISLFVSAFSLALRLCMPFIAAELVLELSMGVLMKLIPQIHVFMINIQFKMLLALFMLLAFAQPIADFLDRYMDIMFQSIQQVLRVSVG